MHKAIEGDPARREANISSAIFTAKNQLYSPKSVRGKWKLAEHWEDYEHSSTKLYVKNIFNGFVSVHYEELSCKILIAVAEWLGTVAIASGCKGNPATTKCCKK